MFDTTDLANLELDVNSLAELPATEDGRFEYKSSKTPDADLGVKLAKAGSAFWNSGGGFFVAGVDDGGAPDGGIAPKVGRQSREDWVDRVLAGVMPRGTWSRHLLNGQSAEGTLESGKTVLVVAFQESHLGPHMAPDQRYYVRAGAHTEPASQFIVEAIRARRGAEAPQLAFFFRVSQSSPGKAELVIANLSPVPALDVEHRFSRPG